MRNSLVRAPNVGVSAEVGVVEVVEVFVAEHELEVGVIDSITVLNDECVSHDRLAEAVTAEIRAANRNDFGYKRHLLTICL